MGYSREVCKRAAEELSRRRQAAETEAVARHARVVAKQPGVLDCERRMAASAGQIARVVLNGGDVEAALAEARRENEQAQQELAALIAAAGETGTDFTPRYTCPLCEDTGYKGNHICACQSALLAQYACETLSKSSGMKLASFDEMDLTYYDETVREKMAKNLDFCREYGEQFDTSVDSLLLFGSTGTGKTHAALSIAKLATERGFSVIYGPVQTLLRKLEKEHFGKEEGDTEESLLSCDLLILDDVGTEMSTAFTNACLYNILNGRILAGLPTVVSTNLTAADWAPRYGDAVASRVLGTFVPLAFSGNDVRQAKLERRLADEG